jgi:LPS sulfotransferase NodH
LLKLALPNIKSPVFVIGAPRSGTTFLGSCIAEIPEISYFFEPVITKAAVRAVYTKEWSYRKAGWIYRQVYAWLLRIQLDPDLRFCEKTPGNCFILPFLQETFPRAKFIHIIRDGRDSAVSLAKKPWYQNAMNGEYRRDPDGYLYGSGKRFWGESDRVDEYENTTDYHRCMWLWRRYVEEAKRGCEKISEDQLLEIRYEELVSEPISNAEAILDFLDIRNVDSRQLFIDTVHGRARKDSLARWESELTQSEKNTLYKEAGELLNDLGYSE